MSALASSKCPTVRAFAAQIAHLAASKFAELGLDPPAEEVKGVAVLDHVGVRILVSITLHDKEPYREVFAPVPSTPSDSPLKEIERCIMDAAPRHDAEPITMTKLARISGYSCNGHFRGHVAGLIDRGLLVRVTGGIRQAKR